MRTQKVNLRPINWFDRLMARWADYLEPPDATELAEREFIQQVARRMKLRTDLQEARIKARAERRARAAEVFNLVATWRYEFMHGGREALAVVNLSQSGTKREVKLVRVHWTDKGEVISSERHGPIFSFLKTTKQWTGFAQPWLDGTLSNAQLRKLAPKGVQFAGSL